MDPVARFVHLVQGVGPVPLDEATLLVAACAYPGLDVGRQIARLDDLAAGCAPTLDGVRAHLFREVGFRGDADDYYDPRNSFLNEVLDRRVGIPISLSVLTMEVARRVGVPLVGIGMPGHFLVRHRDDEKLFVDPFHGGVVLDRAGCAARFHAVHGAPAAFRSEFLEPVSERMILARMLGNLKEIYLRRGDVADALWVMRLRTAIPGTAGEEVSQLADALAARGRFPEAAGALEALAARLAPGEQADALLARARLLRARLN